MAGLSVNLDCLGALRDVFGTPYPDITAAAIMSELGNAEGIEVHLAEKEFHIREKDIIILRHIIKTRLILKISPTSEKTGSVLNLKPDLVVIEPEHVSQVFSKSSLDYFAGSGETEETIKTIQESGLPVCMLINPDPDHLKMAHKLNVSMVEIYTGTFCGLKSPEKKQALLNQIVDVVKLAHKLKLGIRVGSGLCYNSVKAFRELHEIDEFSIGRSIITKAFFTGMESAVKEMVNLVSMI